MLSQMWDQATNCVPYTQGNKRADHERNNQLYSKHLQQVLRLRGRWEWSHSMGHGCVAGSQIQDPVLMLGVDGAYMGLNEARDTNPQSYPLGGMLGRDWFRRGGKMSRYDVSFSSRTCNTIFVDCIVQDAYGNVVIRIGR